MSTMTAPHMLNHRYDLHDKIGEATFGEAYCAEDRLTGNIVALKHMTAPAAQLVSTLHGDDSQLNLALAHEFCTLASVRHSDIISVLDYGFDLAQKPYFTMRLLEHSTTILNAGEGQPVETQARLLVELLQR